MNTSPDEALDLLRKWDSEHTPLTVLLALSESRVTVKVSGYINGLTDDILISDGTKSSDDSPCNYLIFPARSAQSFEYAEPKDFKQLEPEVRQYFIAKHGPANLRIVLTDGASISFFEAPSSN
jgi:hypothetical protein